MERRCAWPRFAPPSRPLWITRDGLPVFAGGHSMSGRMVSMACSHEPMDGLKWHRVFRISPARGKAECRTRSPSAGCIGTDAVSLRAAGQDGGHETARARHSRAEPCDAPRGGYRGPRLQGAETKEYRRTRSGGTGQGGRWLDARRLKDRSRLVWRNTI